jgi:hypothetical protein
MSRNATTIWPALLGLFVALPAAADVPSPQNSIVPPMLTVVETSAFGVPDPAGTFTVRAVKLSGQPVAFASFALSFYQCPDVEIATDQRDAQVYVDCTGKTVRGEADAQGYFTFRVLGHGHNFGASPGATGPTLDVYADGVLLRTIPVAVVDQGTPAGVDASDLSGWLQDYLSGIPFARSDYDGDGSIGAADLALWHDVFFGASSTVGTGPTCP